MKTGNCAVYSAATGVQNCRTERSEVCNRDYWLGYCDAPTGKRYLFMGTAGLSPSADQRPPESAKNAADFERILRSIEFKKT